jgi:hypothetical protein
LGLHKAQGFFAFGEIHMEAKQESKVADSQKPKQKKWKKVSKSDGDESPRCNCLDEPGGVCPLHGQG